VGVAIKKVIEMINNSKFSLATKESAKSGTNGKKIGIAKQCTAQIKESEKPTRSKFVQVRFIQLACFQTFLTLFIGICTYPQGGIVLT
tara:strand:- start:1104 stop:1367 length:264 start_codon:yes stop_codon:yes gene_type:complete